MTRKLYTVFADSRDKRAVVPGFYKDYAKRATALTVFGKLVTENKYARIWVRDYSDPDKPQTIADTDPAQSAV